MGIRPIAYRVENHLQGLLGGGYEDPLDLRSTHEFEAGHGRGSREDGPDSISRASLINFLEAMRGAGVLNCEEITGKGGYPGLYSSTLNEVETKTDC